MATPSAPNTDNMSTNDLPPPYSAVVGNPQYGFVVPNSEPHPTTTEPGVYPHPKTFTAPGVYPHPTTSMPPGQSHPGAVPPPPPPGISVGVVMAPAVGSEPTTITCYNCNKVVTTRVVYTTAWHTHLAAGSVCIITM